MLGHKAPSPPGNAQTKLSETSHCGLCGGHLQHNLPRLDRQQEKALHWTQRGPSPHRTEAEPLPEPGLHTTGECAVRGPYLAQLQALNTCLVLVMTR